MFYVPFVIKKGLKSQPTGHGDELFNQAETSTDLSQSPTNPVALSRYKSGSDWSARRTTSPDILAEILVREC